MLLDIKELGDRKLSEVMDKMLVSGKFIWHGLRRQVGTWVKGCYECQSSKVQKHTRVPLETFTVPDNVTVGKKTLPHLTASASLNALYIKQQSQKQLQTTKKRISD